MERETSYVRGRLTESKHVGIIRMHDTCIGTRHQDHFHQAYLSLLSDFPGPSFPLPSLFLFTYYSLELHVSLDKNKI